MENGTSKKTVKVNGGREVDGRSSSRRVQKCETSSDPTHM